MLHKTATVLSFPGSTYTYTMSYGEFYSIITLAAIGTFFCWAGVGTFFIWLFRRRRKD